MLPSSNPNEVVRARGTVSRPKGRFERFQTQPEHDGWDIPEDARPVRTEVAVEHPRSVIARNDSPDLPFDRSLNPYRGCEHGCVYCFARPFHSFLGLSPGLDFETKLVAKPDAAALLAREIARPGYHVAPIGVGTATDPYQPVEARFRIMPAVLRVLSDWNHPLWLVTRGALVLRDRAILADMAERDLVAVGISLTTLDAGLARSMEPRAPSPATRLRMIEALAEAGVPVRVMVAPVIPALTDAELEAILHAAREAGAGMASMTLLRLLHEVAPLFRDWLERIVPGRAAHVMNHLQAMRGGRDYDARFGTRMRGEGVEADLLWQRFRLACRRLGYDKGRRVLDCSRFGPPRQEDRQLNLF